ncbi:MAG: hydantoinase/carbamoylase family amidase [Anaerolineales bacterium]|nr:hydantoinase/carbamoylase family amidase [Anaerolineales bacterium]
MTLLINADRLRADFEALSQIGATGDGGVDRPCWSPAHLEAQRWWLGRAAEAGLAPHTDPAGNVSAVWPSAQPGARTLLVGSHTDSVPRGGRFDGALGVLAALEAARSLREAGLSLPVHIEVIDFADEEGTLLGLLGSKALAGTLTAAALAAPRGGRPALEAGMARAGVAEAGLLAARRDPAGLAGYLELHIEQGPTLMRNAIPIGVVQGIVGIRSLRLTYHGQANHAGTTPMDQRLDASLGAAAFTLTARELVLRDFPGCTLNIGHVRLAPGAFNIIPGTAELGVEFRAPDLGRLDDLQSVLLGLADVVGRQFGLTPQAEALAGDCAPTPLGARAIAALTAAADSLALRHTTLFSGAGHDAMSLAPLTEAGMVFIPSRAGVSHAPQEFSEWEDCVNGANVLLRAALALASAP